MNNLYVYNWESDYLAITKSMYAYEVEVKISKADFEKDFEKTEKHLIISGKLNKSGNEDICRYLKPNYFYYAMPEKIAVDCDVPDYAGLIIISGRQMSIWEKAPLLHNEKFEHSNFNLIDKFYYNWQNERRKAREVEGMDLKNEFSKSVKYAKARIKDDMINKAKEAFVRSCDYAYWPEGGMEIPGMTPTCSVFGERCKIRCDKGKIFVSKLK